MAPDLTAKDVNNFAWLLMKPRNLWITIEEPESIEFVFGLPLDHPLHLPRGILTRRTDSRPRHDFPGPHLSWLGKTNVTDHCVLGRLSHPDRQDAVVEHCYAFKHQSAHYDFLPSKSCGSPKADNRCLLYGARSRSDALRELVKPYIDSRIGR
jgi:hypothetical protein